MEPTTTGGTEAQAQVGAASVSSTPPPAPNVEAGGLETLSKGLAANTAQPSDSAQPVSAPQTPTVPAAQPDASAAPAQVPAEVPTPTQAFQGLPSGASNPADLARQRDEAILMTIQGQAFQEAVARGANPQQAAQFAQATREAATTELRNQSMVQALESHPVTVRLAAEKAVAPYLAWGVKPEDVLDARSPNEMIYAAYKLAKANAANASKAKATALDRRIENGNDRFDGGTQTAGPVINYEKSRGIDIVRSALRAGLSR